MTDFLPIILVAGSITVFIIWNLIAELLKRKRRKKYKHNIEIRDLKVEALEAELERIKAED